MISQRFLDGANSLINSYVKAKSGDQFILVFSPECAEQVAAVSFLLAKFGFPVRRVPMTPLVDSGFYGRFIASLPSSNALRGRLVVLTFERETMSHDQELRRALEGFPDDRTMVFRSISTCDELFEYGLSPTPEELSALNTSLLEACMPAREIEIKTNSGTDLSVKLDSTRHRWISNRGQWRENSFVILPAGEVATYPDAIDGTIVADFAFNVNALTEISSRLSETPVTVEISNGRATNYACESAEVMRFLDDCFSKYCAYNVGEIGLGTNFAVHDPIHLNSHINERRPGVHLGFGQHNQGDGVEYRCDIHLDLICSGGVITVKDTGQVIDLEDVRPSVNPHPVRTRDEDVFSPRIDELEVDDCCGIVSSNGVVLFNR